MNEKEHHEKTYYFYVDAKKYDTKETWLTGAAIKKLANVQETYQLFEEEEGDKADRMISDPETVKLDEKTRHFFAVPPATFGSI